MFVQLSYYVDLHFYCDINFIKWGYNFISGVSCARDNSTHFRSRIQNLFNVYLNRLSGISASLGKSTSATQHYWKVQLQTSSRKEICLLIISDILIVNIRMTIEQLVFIQLYKSCRSWDIHVAHIYSFFIPRIMFLFEYTDYIGND